MEIVFVQWSIIKGREEDFKQHWRTWLPVNDRTGLVGEFLSEPSGHEKYDWVTWDLRGSNASTIFINIGPNMPGAGSNAAAAHLFNVAPRDGTVIGALQNSALLDALRFR